MSSATQAPGQSPDQPDLSLVNRYGRPKRRLSLRAWIVIAVVGILVASGFLYFLNARNARTFEPKDISFDVVSSRQTDVTVAVAMRPGESVTCALQVLSEDYAVVGYKEADYTAPADADVVGGQVIVQHKVPIRTTFEGVSGGAAACWEN